MRRKHQKLSHRKSMSIIRQNTSNMRSIRIQKELQKELQDELLDVHNNSFLGQLFRTFTANRLINDIILDSLISYNHHKLQRSPLKH